MIPPIPEWMQQLQSDEVREIVAAAVRNGWGVQVVLRVNANGKVGKPKVSAGE